MQIIDAHHHIWAPQSPELDVGYGWLKDIGAMKPFGDPTPIQRDYLFEEFLAEPGDCKLAASVHVQADPKLADPVAETKFVQQQASTARHSVAIVGFADLTSDLFQDQISRHLQYPSLRGIRQIISYLPDRPEISFAPVNHLDNSTWRQNFASLARHGLRFDLQLYPEQMEQAADLLADHPDVPVVIDHLGSPYDSSLEGMSVWRAGMRALAALPHVHAKLSGYAMFFGSSLDGSAVDVTQEILTLFSHDRVMFGSNYPVDKLHLTYPDLLAFALQQVGDDRDARQAVFAANAARFYGISGP